MITAREDIYKGELIYIDEEGKACPWRDLKIHQNIVGIADEFTQEGDIIHMVAGNQYVLFDTPEDMTIGENYYYLGRDKDKKMWTPSLSDFSSGDYIYKAFIKISHTHILNLSEFVTKKS